MEIERIILKHEARNNVRLPRSDVLYVIADLIETLVTESMEKSGIDRLSEDLKNALAQARLERAELVGEMRSVKSKLDQLRHALDELREQQTHVKEDKKEGWFSRLF